MGLIFRSFMLFLPTGRPYGIFFAPEERSVHRIMNHITNHSPVWATYTNIVIKLYQLTKLKIVSFGSRQKKLRKELKAIVQAADVITKAADACIKEVEVSTKKEKIVNK